nr:immunoglobulin light chain junction region [Macaca mulatta]MOX84618.1 immunoglobulin light chain junction region [Macaca mulatta]MOX85951.1 immunoglobulin light chain junction region [Macaca mulatta]MOX87015.1 immunoglobulin light chain junction region [Macaca mulatta]MOX87431.1 immunoglobulin light chain junction region [Macaca mulatta]
CLQVYRTPFTF